MTPEQAAVLISSIAALIGAIAAVVSAIFAIVAVRTQRAAQLPHVTVRHTTPMPVFGGVLGDPWFCINVVNDGLLPVTVNSAGLTFLNGNTAPFMSPPSLGVVLDTLPARLGPGEEVTLWLDGLRPIAEAHREQGGAKWVSATLAGGRESHGPLIPKSWLDGW